MQHTLAQQINVCPPKHLPLQELNPCNMPLYWTGAPRRGERVPDSCFISAERCSECLEIRHTTGCTRSQPIGEVRCLACPHHLLKLVCQRVYTLTIDPWLDQHAVATSILVYGEVVEYLKRLAHFPHQRTQLREQLQEIRPYLLIYPIMERYATIRQQLRPPHGPGLIGDIDTLIAATALEQDLTLVTTDNDFKRVPNLKVLLIIRATL